MAKSRAFSMTLRMVVMLVVIGVILGGIFGFQVFKSHIIAQVLASRSNPAQTVSTTVAAKADWQDSLQAVGSFRALNGANLSSEAAGIVDSFSFADGQDVAAGAVLVQLRLDNDVSTLHQLQATADNAQVTYDRDLRQLKAQGVSQATVDSDLATLKSARAQVEGQQALIDEKTVKAPFAGRLGTRQVDLGQYLSPGTTMVTLQALDPILLDFTLPQQALAQIKTGQAVTATVDTWPGKGFDGKIIAISPVVDTSSRSLTVRASFANPDHQLLPGMFGKVSIGVGAPQQYVTLPATAVTINPYGNVVFLVTEKDANGQKQQVANQTFVTTGGTRGDQIAVLKGVEAGQTVVTSGQLKLQNGSPVTVNNAVTPPSNPNAAPADPS
ncbi:membrane fusion protein (multidrug efflux system) [Inquilinus ginsengisoli]|uniref:Membrane fusion protein (Multidrug efflux system) n=2 Tax=Inquilinus TaxID=171673 RepID=A0ABU1JU28_9PROT|nr:efflux RND transporter periplasmic adaptor subunit [Inquilinus ginsengisoli]MDR6291090.1 membrane fusion protein (multidrug efflux system) [Inquilinus ginsengisoli]